MIRRALAFALAFVVIGAPLAGDLCRVFCAQHAGHSIDPTVPLSGDYSAAASHAAHQHHSGAPPAPATGSVALRLVSHECDQPVAVIGESRELSRTPVMGAAAIVARITPTLTHVLPPSDVDGRHGPPDPIRSASPLQI